MRYYACYRLFAAVDISISIICIFLWTIFYFKASDLISLQFENHSGNKSLVAFVKNHKGVLRFAGTQESPESSAEMLRELYEEVHRSCKAYYKRYKIKQHGKKQHDHLLLTLEICVALQIISMGVFLTSGLVMVATTRHAKQASKRVLVSISTIEIIFYFVYTGAGVFIGLDPQFCALITTITPYRVKVGIYTFAYKPYFYYVIYQYYKDISSDPGLLSDQNSNSSISTPTMSEASSSAIYELEKGLGISDYQLDDDVNNNNNEEITTEDHLQQENLQVAQSLANVGVKRKTNFTNIPQDHLDGNQMGQIVTTPSGSGSYFRRFFGRKVAPMNS